MWCVLTALGWRQQNREEFRLILCYTVSLRLANTNKKKLDFLSAAKHRATGFLFILEM